MTSAPVPRLSFEGPGALIVDAGAAVFSDAVQARIWRLARDLKRLSGVDETVPGMNNLMVVFDPLATDVDHLRSEIINGLKTTDAQASAGRLIDVPVRYGGADTDLADFSAALGLSEQDVIARHSAPVYSVAAVGAMPGFVYLSGLDPALAAPRRPVPRSDVPAGAVMIGGAQTGIMPITAPSGWHVLGHTPLALFSPFRDPPALFKAGDRLRFVTVPA